MNEEFEEWKNGKVKQVYEDMRKQSSLSDKWFQEVFEAGQNSKESNWIKGVPEHKSGPFLLVVKPKDYKYNQTIKAFYAEKFKVNVGYPDDDFFDDFYDQDEYEEFYLKEGFYEDTQCYYEEGRYCLIPEEDIVAWQPLPKL